MPPTTKSQKNKKRKKNIPAAEILKKLEIINRRHEEVLGKTQNLSTELAHIRVNTQKIDLIQDMVYRTPPSKAVRHWWDFLFLMTALSLVVAVVTLLQQQPRDYVSVLLTLAAMSLTMWVVFAQIWDFRTKKDGKIQDTKLESANISTPNRTIIRGAKNIPGALLIVVIISIVFGYYVFFTGEPYAKNKFYIQIPDASKIINPTIHYNFSEGRGDISVKFVLKETNTGGEVMDLEIPYGLTVTFYNFSCLDEKCNNPRNYTNDHEDEGFHTISYGFYNSSFPANEMIEAHFLLEGTISPYGAYRIVTNSVLTENWDILFDISGYDCYLTCVETRYGLPIIYEDTFLRSFPFDDREYIGDDTTYTIFHTYLTSEWRVIIEKIFWVICIPLMLLLSNAFWISRG